MVSLAELKEVRFLQDIADEHLTRLAEIAQVQDLPADVVVFREGQPCRAVFLVLAGDVALELNVPGQGATRVHTVGEGELLGWSPLVDPGPMTATARTLRPCRLIAIDGLQLSVLCEHNPRFGLEFMRRTVKALAKRLNATRLQLLDVFRHELPSFEDQGGEA